MKAKLRLVTICALAVWLACLVRVSAEEVAPLRLVQTIPLPDVRGGFNHMSADAAHHRLFATATKMKTLEIIDLKSGKRWRSLPGDGSAASLFVPEFNQLYVTRHRSVDIYDANSSELVTNIDLQNGLDELGCNPTAKELYVGCMSSNDTAIAVISLPDGKLKGEIKLPAKPQGFAVEQTGTRIYVNLPRPQQVVVLDRKKEKLVESWTLKEFAGNYPVALDESNHRLFVGCRNPARLLVLDTATGKPVADVAIDDDTDDLSYDAAQKRIYVACGVGFLDVIEQLDANHYQSGGHIPIPVGSRNCCFAPGANEFYLAVPQRDGQDPEIRVYQPK